MILVIIAIILYIYFYKKHGDRFRLELDKECDSKLLIILTKIYNITCPIIGIGFPTIMITLLLSVGIAYNIADTEYTKVPISNAEDVIKVLKDNNFDIDYSSIDVEYIDNDNEYVEIKRMSECKYIHWILPVGYCGDDGLNTFTVYINE